ncbi:ABC transporter ATP-binding protein [Pelagibius litoralis]|uniref:ABC transporter ATP-binding protein n=1 Tax=Pelagibius litoralis TaxID=374515 RepID=A0A967KD68_9PROT|nr:ABC transporter ATP-binding protein [Pelagibius litoralis]NIA72087.1 ABC transporter ATP-binding protein [Pelagibius litoralis]
MTADRAHLAPPEVACRSVAKTFFGAGGPIEAVDPTSLTFRAGETTALVGPSGCGKSTLLRLIAGLEVPTSGEVLADGLPSKEIRRRAGLAIGFQDSSLLPWRTVRGNIALALKLARMPEDPPAVDRLIALVGLSGFEDRRPAELSGGMRQRAAIARCLVTRPGLLLLDEPFGAVDELTRRRLAEDLPRLWEANGTTTIFVTHSVTEAILIADRVIVLSPRPAKVLAEIDVTLDRPRSGKMTGTEPFRDLIVEVSAALVDGEAQGGVPIAAQ